MYGNVHSIVVSTQTVFWGVMSEKNKLLPQSLQILKITKLHPLAGDGCVPGRHTQPQHAQQTYNVETL